MAQVEQADSVGPGESDHEPTLAGWKRSAVRVGAYLSLCLVETWADLRTDRGADP